MFSQYLISTIIEGNLLYHQPSQHLQPPIQQQSTLQWQLQPKIKAKVMTTTTTTHTIQSTEHGKEGLLLPHPIRVQRHPPLLSQTLNQHAGVPPSNPERDQNWCGLPLPRSLGNGSLYSRRSKSGCVTPTIQWWFINKARARERKRSHYRLQVHKNLYLDVVDPKHFEGHFINDVWYSKYKVNARFTANYNKRTCSTTEYIRIVSSTWQKR